MARYETAKTLINRAAGEMGILANTDPYSTNDEAFTTLANLLNSAGQELVELRPWQKLRKKHTLTTTTASEYDLPSDFSYMIDQSHWDETNDLPLGGPLSGQAWAYLDGSGSTSTIYAQFNQEDGKLQLWPDPQTAGQTIAFYYISRNWAEDADGNGLDWTTTSEDTVLFEPILMQKYLKAKYLEAKNLPSQAARAELEMIFNSRKGKDTGGSILNAGGSSRGFPYIDNSNLPLDGWG